mmetsp:Transcript_9523/g.10595  ORF Transcript_9523/g.10595 Transcript_9523/m.10595 type:complete len:105 (-) Transcript_9523:445-759(-)
MIAVAGAPPKEGLGCVPKPHPQRVTTIQAACGTKSPCLQHHRLAGRTWRDSTILKITEHAAPKPTMMWRKPKQHARPMWSALASQSRATYARENIAPTFPKSIT